MIGAEASLTPQSSQQKKKPLANALGNVRAPSYVSEGTIEDAQNNIIAQGYRTPRVQARRGFSNSKYTASQQGLQDAAALGQASSQAAGVAAEAQAFNASLRDQYDQLRDKTLADRRSHDLMIHDALMAYQNQGKQYAQGLRLGNEVQKENLRQSLLGRML